MNHYAEVLGGGLIMMAIVIIVFILAKCTYLIKKAMIERELVEPNPNTRYRFLDIGCIIIGFGLGLLIAAIFTKMDLTEDTMDLLTWGTILIGGGLGFLTAYNIKRKIEE